MRFNKDRGKEGRLRTLSNGEIRLARSVFGNTLVYHRVWVHKESYLPFSLQSKNYGMSPNGEIYFRDKEYSDDYSLERPADQHFFIHEMVHVYQHQRGMMVRMRGLMSSMADYDYTFEENRNFTDYSMEQQASIVADFFFLRRYGRQDFIYLNSRRLKGIIDESTILNFEKLLQGTGFPR